MYNAILLGQRPDDADFQRFIPIVKDRLCDLDFKQYHYILIANKVPPKYRGTPHLSFLQNIPWMAVFDLFDPATKKDGLHFICNEMNDAPRASITTLDDFKDFSPDWIDDKNCTLFTKGTTWILQPENLQDKEWITCSAKYYFYRALSAFKQHYPLKRLIVVILGLGENAITEMADISESCFTIFGGDVAKKCVTIISENDSVLDALMKASKPTLQRRLRDCSISNISWELLKEIVRMMVGPTEFQEKGATTILPFITGPIEVLNKIIHSWEDLEIYCPNPRLTNSTEEIEKARDTFYKGGQVSQVNLLHNHSIQRTLEEELIQKIEQAVNSLKALARDSCSVRTITLLSEPGSGATTLCRRILWSKRKEYRCAVIKSISKTTTDFQISKFQAFGYDESQSISPPALILSDNFPEIDTQGLSERLQERGTKCVLIATYPVGRTDADSTSDNKPLGQLDEHEMTLVRKIVIDVTMDKKRRREAEEVLERERRFIWLGLELFGREYVKIEERVRNHIQSTLSTLGDSRDAHERLLHFCCFLHFYSNGADILPHSVLVDFLHEASGETDSECAQVSYTHDKFGGLILDEFNETYGYHGWRPAHSLVSEFVKSQMNVKEIAEQLLEHADRGTAYVNKYLKQQLFQILLHRERVSNEATIPQEEDVADDEMSTSIETEEQGSYDVRTRYSPLILEILGGEDGSRRTLDLLITVCQKARKTKYIAFAWQYLARFIGYEMRFKKFDGEDILHSRLFDEINSNREGEAMQSMPETGDQAAHVAIDIAINLQPKYRNHYTTKGVLYILRLRDLKAESGHDLEALMPDVIDIGRKALEVYDHVIPGKHGHNLYSVIGKIQVIVLLLKIVKSLPCFYLENSSYTRYLEGGKIPTGMADVLPQEDHSFIQSLGQIFLDTLNELFQDVKYKLLTTCDENETRHLSCTNVRACKLRREFYEITEFDRSEIVDTQEDLLSQAKEAALHLRQVVQDVLFRENETSYSAWCNLDDEAILRIYHLLKQVFQRGRGNHDDMVIFCRACLRLQQTKVPVEELESVVQKWVKRNPDSEWAHLFNYMIHFPIPNGSLATNTSEASKSVEKCWRNVRQRRGMGARKSATEYFLGNGMGLSAIVSRQQFPELEKNLESKTDFWRSEEVSETLLRVRGQKKSKGIITYHGIQLHFDDSLYPRESKDDLWFYVGFSVAGPYAFDPIDKDTYNSIMNRKQGKRRTPHSSMRKSKFGGNAAKSVVPSRRKNQKVNQLRRIPAKVEAHTSFQDCKKLPRELASCPSGSEIYSQSANEALDLPLAASNESPKSGMTGASTGTHKDGANSTQICTYATVVKQTAAKTQAQGLKPSQLPSRQTLVPQKGGSWKAVEGTRGGVTQEFQPTHVDQEGRLHHGFKVLGAFKSVECRIHKGPRSLLSDIDDCSFAHSWKGDTRQFVCIVCTRERKYCRQKEEHKKFIWDLGPYLNENGTLWKNPYV